MEEEKYQWDFEELRIKAIQETTTREIEKLKLDPNRFVDADISPEDLLGHLKDYKAPRERLWIRSIARTSGLPST